MESRESLDIMNVFGHRLDGPDTIQYRVQWADRRCEWVDGNFFDNQQYAKYVIRYWQVGPHEFTDIESQTEPCYAFDFSITQENISNWARSFHSFKPHQISQEPYCLIPYSIDSINVEKRIALVHLFEEAEATEMDLDRLLLIAPSMVAKFYMNIQ